MQARKSDVKRLAERVQAELRRLPGHDRASLVVERLERLQTRATPRRKHSG
jgi:hypothetical protein